MSVMIRRRHFCFPGLAPSTGFSGSDGPLQISLVIRSHTQARSPGRTRHGRLYSPAFRILAKGACLGEPHGVPDKPFPLAMPFQTGRFRRLHLCILNCEAKFPLFRGELHYRNSEARVSRMTGKFDTTARGRKRQVGFFDTSVAGVGTDEALPSKRAHKAKAPPPRGVAPRHLDWSLASRNKCGGSCPPSAYSRLGFPLRPLVLAVALAGFCVLSRCQTS